MRKRYELKTIEQYGEDCLVYLLGEGSESDKIVRFSSMQRYLPAAIRWVENLSVIGESKKIIVLATFSLMKTKFVSSDEQGLASYWIDHQLPELIDQIVLLARSKALVKQGLRLCSIL